jgi:hypothetical protein
MAGWSTRPASEAITRGFVVGRAGRRQIAFTAEAAFESQEHEIDDALMIALRMMEER